MDVLQDLVCCCGGVVTTWAECLCCLCNAVPRTCLHGLDHCCTWCCPWVCHCCMNCWNITFCCHLNVSGEEEGSVPSFKITAASIILVLLLLYCIVLGAICIVIAFLPSSKDCSTVLQVHLVLQGFGLLSISGLFIRICLKFYIKPTESAQTIEGAAFQRFWWMFKSDWILTILTLASLSAFVWALIGFAWLSQAHCDQTNVVLLDSLSGISLVLVVGISGAFTFLLFTLMSCDEGSCTYDSLGSICFLCCCYCCIKHPRGLNQTMSARFQSSRSLYTKERNFCLDKALKTLHLLGFVKSEYAHSRYVRNEDLSVAQELRSSAVIPETNVPMDKNVSDLHGMIVTTSNSPPFWNPGH